MTTHQSGYGRNHVLESTQLFALDEDQRPQVADCRVWHSAARQLDSQAAEHEDGQRQWLRLTTKHKHPNSNERVAKFDAEGQRSEERGDENNVKHSFVLFGVCMID